MTICHWLKLKCQNQMLIYKYLLFHFDRYVEIAKLLIENGSKIDFREPTDELYPRTMLSDEPLRLAMKNRNYVN